MVVRALKLRPTRRQASEFSEWLRCATGIYNWAIRKIQLDANDGVRHSAFDLVHMVAGHGKKIGIPSAIVASTVWQAHNAWKRCFSKIAKRPNLKGNRNRMKSVPVSYAFTAPKNGRVRVPLLGKIRFHKQTLPGAKIKQARLMQRPSGWYLILWFDCDNTITVEENAPSVGIDPGFSTLLTLSDGTKISNPRELRVGEARLSQAQRARNKPLAARIYERQENRRRDRNHKISRRLVERFSKIYYSSDNFNRLAVSHGKSVTEASLGQLIRYLTYKGRLGGRDVVPVDSKFTTMTCSTCGARTGPTGWGGLAVRQWNCACGAQHDRDINAARNVLLAGAGCVLKGVGNSPN